MLFLIGLLGMMAVGGIVLMDGAGSASVETDDDIAGTDVPEGDGQGDLLDEIVGESTSGLTSYVDEAGNTQTIPNIATDDADLLIGSDEGDMLDGGDGHDRLTLGFGDDYATGGEGNDSIDGNGGDDTLMGGDGADLLTADEGDDQLFGEEGDDVLYGNAGHDALDGGLGNDQLFGGEGNDSMVGGAGDDALTGSAGNDWLEGGDGQDTLSGGSGNDVLNGWETDGDDADTLNGGAGDDTIFAGAGDVVSGGEGADMAVFEAERSEHEDFAEFWDFQSGQDTLIVLYDSGSSAPDIDIVANPDISGQWFIQANGETVAMVAGDTPHFSDISVMENAA